MWQLQCIATWVSPTPRQSLSALISSPVPSLKSLSLSVAAVERLYCWYVTLRYDLDLWSLILNICSIPAVSSNSVPNLSAIEQSAAELLRFEYLSFYDLEHVSRVAQCSGIVCTKFTVRQAIRSWNVTIFDARTSYHAMTFTFDPLILKGRRRSGVTWP